MNKSLLELLSEDVRNSKEKAKADLENHEKDLDKYRSGIKLMYGKFSGFTIGDLLEQSSYADFKRVSEGAEKLLDKIENQSYKIDDIHSDMFDEYQDEKDQEAYSISKEASELSNKFGSLIAGLKIISEMGEKIAEYIDHLNEYKKLKHLKDFQEGLK